MIRNIVRQFVVIAAVLTVVIAGFAGSAAAEPPLKKPGDGGADPGQNFPDTIFDEQFPDTIFDDNENFPDTIFDEKDLFPDTIFGDDGDQVEDGPEIQK